jgi:general stress protein YciG
MAGTKLGGQLAAITNKTKFGPDFYAKIGAQGGKRGKADGAIKGFAANPERAREAGRKGGTISRRGKGREA